MSALLLRGPGRARAWAGYLGSVGLGAGAVALAAVWTSGPWAAGIGAAVTTLAGLAAERMRPDETAAAVGAGEVLRTPGGRVPLLCQVDRPELAGAHPAEAPGPAPAYIERDAEPGLRAALERARFVLVVGESTAGKTRLAYEVARTRYPRHAFVRPLSRAALPEAVRIAARRRRAVLWLDDLEDHLGAGGLTALHLASLDSAVVIATMRVQEYRRYDAREESRLTGSDRDAWRAQRDLLQQATVLRLPRHWSEPERRRAAAHRGDPRIGAALRAGERFGVAEVLAAGPELLASWENGWAPGANPRGAAVVAAAVDCRRAGLRRPVSREWLRELHAPYLAARGGGDLQPEPFAEAMDWACAAAYATSGLLIGNYGAGFTAFDYLVNAPGHAGVPVPDHLWRGLLARVDAADAYDMGLVAHQDGRLARAVEALDLARRGGVPGAELPLAIAIGDSGKPRRASADLAGIARRRADRWGPRHPETLAARHQLAFFIGESGAHRAASARFAALVSDAEEVLGPDHPDTLAARHQLAYFTGASGDTSAAARQLEALLADRLRVHGPGHPLVLAARRSLIWFGSGDPAAADRELAELLAEAEERIGPDDPHTLAIRGSRAALAARAGRAAEAADAWAELAEDRTRVLGADHPHVIYARLEWARALIARGRTSEAGELLTAVLAHAQTVLEPGHLHLRTARELLAEVRDRAGREGP
ncbi:tetratricopeptide repeat protein [Streptomyces sp. NBC_00503]|uniref:tetratricopeptide repeat protein n=1 Tax=Streptomyces sp. NBC_00503 TaxID=2903659 RepID=UPI002E806AC7|nr:tetratricopeptide repeat protein [Streptomyces sp. NBC_00503]WUD85044.1 tetratricopeptide repeat protein [Streptomyces sp. NBC_00503]